MCNKDCIFGTCLSSVIKPHANHWGGIRTQDLCIAGAEVPVSCDQNFNKKTFNRIPTASILQNQPIA